MYSFPVEVRLPYFARIADVYVAAEGFALKQSLPKISIGYIFNSSYVFQCNGAWWFLPTWLSWSPCTLSS